MPDITMCRGVYIMETEVHPHCKDCYRRTAKPSEYQQSYFVYPPLVEVHDSATCKYHYKEDWIRE